jgi:cysteine sulfinate desulfinase/cysteine desulfurase-like protein
LDAECLTTSLRFGVGRFNTKEEAIAAARLVAEAVESCRSLSGFVEKNPNTSQKPFDFQDAMI